MTSLPTQARSALRRKLLTWFDQHQRDLPWRRTSDPYHILLSELLLQQTRVEAARPYYEAFVTTFPRVQDLADAPLEQVLTLWAGLGYYRRARNLHKAANEIVQRFGARVPDTVEELLTLPGVGRYTAAAVASIAYGKPAAALDGNIKRVLARVYAVRNPIDERETEKTLWHLAEETLATRRAGDFNQALMEIGATVCLPKQPRCLACPLHKWCRAAGEGLTDQIPQKKPKAARPHIEAVAVAIERRGELLMVQRPATGLLAGMWELPGGPLVENEAADAGLARLGRDEFDVALSGSEVLGSVQHVFTHRTTNITVLRGTLRGSLKLKRHAASGWFNTKARDSLPIATLDQKVLQLL